MSRSFRIVALDHEQFLPLFDATKERLAEIGAMRVTVGEKPGYPCRVSLVDAERGELVLSLPFTHDDVRSPDRASGPIFAREGPRRRGLRRESSRRCCCIANSPCGPTMELR